jgi:hypothetical protein
MATRTTQRSFQISRIPSGNGQVAASSSVDVSYDSGELAMSAR